MDSFFNATSRYAHSSEAIDGASRLIESIKAGNISVDVLPNTYENFSGELEHSNFLSFCRFLKSQNGKFVISALEET